jgi:hypothetical protein
VLGERSTGQREPERGTYALCDAGVVEKHERIARVEQDGAKPALRAK